jgi:4-amino-4-deoxy-L-arabinose transferase
MSLQHPSLESRRSFFRLALLVLGIVFVGVYLLPLGLRPLVVPDEARYGVIPAEMIETGDWIVPHLVGIRYFEKPALGYWMTAVSFLGFGENAFSLRLPSAMMSGFSIVLLVLFVRRWTSRWDLAALSGLVLATCLEPAILGTTAVLDAPFSATVTATIVCFYFGWRSVGSARFGWLVAAGVACGAAFLIKGFLAMALPAMVLAPWLMWQGRWRDMFVLPWVPAVAAILTALPWSLAVHWQSAEYWDYFFWIEHVHRFTGGSEAQHPEPWWFFVPIIFTGLIPWVFAAPLALAGLLRRGFGSPESRLLVCWLLIPLAFFSVSSGKLPTYILPCFPAAAAMIAVGLVERFNYAGPKRTFGSLVLGGILIVLGLVAVVSTPFIPVVAQDGGIWQDGGVWRLAIVGIALVFWGLADWVSQRTDDGRGRVLLGGVGTAALFAVIPLMMPTGWMEISKAPIAWMRPYTSLAQQSTVLAGRDFVHAAKWVWPRSDVRLFGDPGEMRWGVENFAEHAESHVSEQEFAQVVQQATVAHPVVLLSTSPDRRLKWIAEMIDRGEVAQPQIVTDRDVILAVWPKSSLPARE